MKKVIYFVVGLIILLNLFLISKVASNRGEVEPLKEITKEPTEESGEKESVEFIVETIEVESIEAEGVENEESKQLSISLVGDILMDGSVKRQINENGYDYPWEYVAKYFQEDDISIGNLETSITLGGAKWPDKQFNFRSDPENLEAMKKAGIDVVSLANNHSLDYGYEGLLDTLNYIDKSGIYRVGAGKDYKEAVEEVVIEKNGYKVGILGFSRVVPTVDWYATSKRPGLVGAYDSQLQGVLEKVKEVGEEVDILILSIHWGTELQTRPNDHDVLAAKKLIDAGADIIMGHHPHILQGVEIYKGKPIFYSLGNFVFGVKNELTSNTMIGQVDFMDDKIKSLKVIPCKIESGRPIPVDELEMIGKIQYINELSQEWGTKFNDNGVFELD